MAAKPVVRKRGRKAVTIEDDAVVLRLSAPTSAVPVEAVPSRVARLGDTSRLIVREIEELQAVSVQVGNELHLMVREARFAGISWSIIAWALGMSETGAKKRFGDLS